MAPTVFFSRTYDEAFDLLLEARNYLTYCEPRDRHRLEIAERLALNCEAMRLTSRLTQIMAWLLVQKAVYVGELTPAQAAAEEFRLSGQDVCRLRGAFAEILPPPLLTLLDRSYELYERVERLDEMAARRAH